MTTGVVVVVVGDEPPVLPVVPEVADDELLDVVAPPGPDEVTAVREVPECAVVLPAPGWAWATAIPIAAAPPVAEMTATRVRMRSLLCVLSLLWGVFSNGRGGRIGDMWSESLRGGGHWHDTTPGSTPSQGPLRASCDNGPATPVAPRPAQLRSPAPGQRTGVQGATMTQVNTVRGPVDGGLLGRTLMHEHIFVLSPEIEKPADEWDESAERRRAVTKLRELTQHGIDTLVDLTVVGLGRYIPRVADIAAQVPEINVVVATGVYTYNDVPMYFHFRGPGTILGGPEPMVDLFVREIREGIGDTGVRAGILKCASDRPGITPGVERVLRAVAQAHRATGVPITTHTPTPPEPWGLEQQRIFTDEGVDLTRVVIGHCGGTVNTDYHLSLIDNGSYLGFDHFGVPGITLEERVDAVARLCARGYAERIVLSHDAMCFVDWFPRAVMDASQTWRWTYISEEVLPVMRARGIGESDIEKMLVENPRTILEGGAPY